MEARNPYRTIGQAILTSSLVVGLFYVVVSYSQTFGFAGKYQARLRQERGVLLWLPYIFLAWVAVALVWYFAARARSPEMARQVGSRFEKIA